MKIPYNIFGLELPYNTLRKINQQDYTEQNNKSVSISHYLCLLNDGHELREENMESVMMHLNSLGISLDEALAINITSETSDIIQEYIRTNTIQPSIDSIMKELANTLRSRGIPHTNIRKVLDIVSGVDYDKSLYSIYQGLFDKLEYKLPDKHCQTQTFHAVKRLRWCYHIEELCQNLFSAIQRMYNKQARIVYRAEKKAPKHDVVHKTGIMSTSATMDASFAKYPLYSTVYTLFVPEGVHCMDIESLSGYDCAEKEILFPNCTIYIIHKEEVNDKLMIYGIVQDATKEE